MSKKLIALTIVLVAAMVVPAIPLPAQAQNTPSGKIVVWGWKAAMSDTLVASGVLDDFKAGTRTSPILSFSIRSVMMI